MDDSEQAVELPNQVPAQADKGQNAAGNQEQAG
jgi:hypothetical protein